MNIYVTHSQTVTIPGLGLLGSLETMSNGTVCIVEADEDSTTWSFPSRDAAVKAIMTQYDIRSVSEIRFGYNVSL